MSVGIQFNSDQVDSKLTQLAVQLRDVITRITQLNTQVNGQGDGLTVLETAGYSGDANPANPASMSDAAYALQKLAYLSTVAGCYLGTVQQGGTGGTGAVEFDFDNALSTVWALQ